MSSIVVSGDTSGAVTLSAPAVAGTVTVTLPSTSGTMASLASVTANGVAYINSSGQPTSGSSLTWDGTNLTVNTGTVSATYGKLTVAGGISITPDSSSKFQIGRYSAGVPYSYIKMGSTSSGLKFTDPADSVDLMTLDSSGNLGLGVTPSAWSLGKAIEVGYVGHGIWGNATNETILMTNAYYNSGWKYSANSQYATQYAQRDGQHAFYNAPQGGVSSIGTAITWTQAMTLDASGNLLVGTTSGSNHIIYKNAAVASRIIAFQGENSGAYTSVAWATADNQGWNGANTVQIIGKNTGTGRSINAAGTVNASGADYAEYMTKADDFTIAKGDVVGINVEGKLTNVFADAVSFVVKSTDPSYVGGDTWGVGLAGDELEDARQVVDRIAFAGQVPVNVTGAIAGQYIVPVNDNGAIKGEAVSNPTFEQYQQAVGKVIAIEADGRARIIVKVA